MAFDHNIYIFLSDAMKLLYAHYIIIEHRFLTLIAVAASKILCVLEKWECNQPMLRGCTT